MRNTKQKYSLYLLISIGFILISSCANQKRSNITKNKTENISIDNGKQVMTVPIISKSFVKKNAVITDQKELYIQASMQDYYIKFCESKISRKELEAQLSGINGEIKSLTLELEFLNGNWDICDENHLQQSRVGEYVIIHRVID